MKAQSSVLPFQKKLAYVIIGILLLLAAFIGFYRLGATPLADWDEAFYGENIKQIVKTNDWVVMIFDKYPFTDKPPLYMWIGAAFVKVLGLSEFAIRLPSAICGVLIIVLVVWYVYKRFGLVPALSAYATLALNDIFIWRTRNGDLDTLSALLFLLIFFFMLSKRNWRYPVLGLLFALLYLTKLALVGVPLAIFFSHEVLFMRKEWRKNLLNYGKLLICMVILPGIWVLAAYHRLGQVAIDSYLLKSDGGAFNLSLSHFSKDYILYAYYSLQRRLFPLLIWGLACVAYGIKKRWQFVLFLFSTVIFVQLLFFERKNNWYLVPLYPFWSISIAYGVKVALDFVKKYRYYQVGVGIFIVVLAVICLRTYQINIYPTFSSYGTTREAQTALKVAQLSRPEQPVVRLDHLYPTAIYYSNRRILASPGDYIGNGGLQGPDYFISRINVVKGINEKRIHWIMGTKHEVQDVINTYHVTPVRLIPTNDEEEIAEF